MITQAKATKLATTPWWLEDRMLDITTFGLGLRALEDTTKAPLGSARTMNNAMITDAGGISPRPGTLLLGALNSNTHGAHGIYNFSKSDGSTEIPVKTYDTEAEYFHPTLLVWARLMNGYTSDQEFGFKEHLVNTDNQDFLYFCNRTEDYSRWRGETAATTVALVGGEVVVTVDSTLKGDIYDRGTSTGTSATTITDTAKNWAASQWINFYVRITSGAQNGQIRLISAVTSTQLTFAALPGDPGIGCTYELRMIKFPASGTLMLNGNQLAYSAVPSDTTFTTSAAVATPINSPLTVVPETFPAAPQGNSLETNYTRMIVGNVRTGLSRDSSGVLQGSQSTRSWYYSKGGTGRTANASDFAFSAARVAGEGGIESIAYGGGNITDIANHEDTFYVLTPNYIEGDKFTQDTNDVPTRQQLKTGFGSVNKVTKAKDDIYFFTVDNQLTSIGRVKLKDTFPQHVNMGLPIKRLLDTMDVTKNRGKEFKNRLFFTVKNLPTDTVNNRVLVFNEQTKSFEGLWELSAFDFMIYKGNLHYIDSQSANVYQMFYGQKDQLGANFYPINMKWLSHWMNLTPKRRFTPKSAFNEQSVDAIGVEGYIRGGTSITFELYNDFSNSASISFTFAGTQQQFLDGSPLSVFLGDQPLGLEPMGMYTLPDQSGIVHFSFIIYFPPKYSNFFSLGILNDGVDQYFEISRLAVGTSEDTIYSTTRINTALNT